MVTREEVGLFKGLLPGNSVLLRGLFDRSQEDCFIDGFVRKSTAPPCIALTVDGISSRPVIKMIRIDI